MTKTKIDINSMDQNGKTPAMIAIENNHIDGKNRYFLSSIIILKKYMLSIIRKRSKIITKLLGQIIKLCYAKR